MKYIVQLYRSHAGKVFIEIWEGKLSTTSIIRFAKRFNTRGSAYIAIGKMMNKHQECNFNHAKVIEVNE
jgi:hypothetical protein